MSRFDDVLAKCPFYKSGTVDELKCEGCQGADTVMLYYHNQAKRNKQKREHCDDDYQSCLIYKMLESKYE